MEIILPDSNNNRQLITVSKDATKATATTKRSEIFVKKASFSSQGSKKNAKYTVFYFHG